MALSETLRKLEQARAELKSLIEKVAVVFVDLAGSTEYKYERGNEPGVERVVTFNLDVTQIIERLGDERTRQGGIEEYAICKYLGDAVMAYFKGRESVKVATQVSEAIQRHFEEQDKHKRDRFERRRPKIAIDFGDVLFAQYTKDAALDPHGLIVDRAARMVRLAKPSQILVSEEVKNSLDGERWCISEVVPRLFKGIKEPVGVCEVIWDEELGIELEKESLLAVVSADPSSVHQFIQERDLLNRSRRVDLYLYTFETVARPLAFDLEQLEKRITFRVILRNPQDDSKKGSAIKTSLGIMDEIRRKNPRVNFGVRFHDGAPLLRTYIFCKENDEVEGLLGLYRYDPDHPMLFIGAEYNYLIHAKGASFLEKHLLDLFRSRFEYSWGSMTSQKAVVFDLDGVLVDSMPIWVKASREAFQRVGIDLDQREVYLREGEKPETTVRDVYRVSKGEEPARHLVGMIIEQRQTLYEQYFRARSFPGARELLRSLKDKGVRLGLVTGSPTLPRRLQKVSFSGLFDVIVTGEDTKKGKPAPDPYARAVELLGVSKSNCYAVENGPLGIQSAAAAGLRCLAVKNTSPLTEQELRNAGADRVYADMKELARHLVWVDTNIELLQFLDIFEGAL